MPFGIPDMAPNSGRTGHFSGRPLPCRSDKGFALATGGAFTRTGGAFARAGGAFTGGPLGSVVVRLRGGFVTGFDHDSALVIGRTKMGN
jgi:hypothetical protein